LEESTGQLEVSHRGAEKCVATQMCLDGCCICWRLSCITVLHESWSSGGKMQQGASS
jgi:hypothetical protein